MLPKNRQSSYVEKQSKADKERREGKNDENYLQVIGALNGLKEHVQSYTEKQDAGDHRKSFREWLTIIGLFVAAGISWYAAHLAHTDTTKAINEARSATDKTIAAMGTQSTTLQGQLDEMRRQRETTVAQLRARMVRSEIKTTPVMAKNNKISGWDVNPTWKNVGQTDAINVIMAWGMRSVDHFPLVDSDCDIPPGPISKPIVIQPGIYEMIIATNLPAGYVVSAANHKSQILIMGSIEYRDIFPDTQTHSEFWCVIAVPNNALLNLWSFVGVKDDIK